MPAFALVVSALEWRRRRTYVEHLVFSVHAITWMLLFMLVAVPLIERPLWLFVVRPMVASPQATGAAMDAANESTLALFIMLGFLLSSWAALRRVYEDGHLKAIVKSAVLALSFMVLIQLYRSLLFFVTYYTS